MTTIEAVKRAAQSEFNVVKWPLILAFVFFVLASTGVLSHAEGRMFPVVAGTDITRAVSKVDGIPQIRGQTLFYGKARKLRMCDFDHIEWWIMDKGIASRVDVVMYERGKVRDGGEFGFGPWGVMLTREELIGRSWATIWSRCHPFFLTATRFHP
jgi:hypothetical protein